MSEGALMGGCTNLVFEDSGVLKLLMYLWVLLMIYWLRMNALTGVRL